MGAITQSFHPLILEITGFCRVYRAFISWGHRKLIGVNRGRLGIVNSTVAGLAGIRT
jgi:hypothetical protein